MFPPVSRVRRRASQQRIAAVGVGAAAMLLLGAGGASAHDSLAAAAAYVPARGAVVVGPLPATITVTFQDKFPAVGDAAHPNTPAARVLDAAGIDHVAAAARNPTNATQLVITTKDRNITGPVRVTWTITASDGHAVASDGTGTPEAGTPLSFTVRASATTVAQTTTATTSTSSSSTSKTVIATIVGVAIVVLIGAGAILFWVRRRRDEFSEESD